MEEWVLSTSGVQGWKGGCVCMLPVLHLRGGSALPHPVGLQPGQQQLQQGEHLKKKQALGADVQRRWAGLLRLGSDQLGQNSSSCFAAAGTCLVL